MGEQQRWTAKRKAEIILQILRQTTTVVDVARQNDLTPGEVQEWIDMFLKAGEKGLKDHASDLQKQTEKEIKELKATVGDLYLKKAILKKQKPCGRLRSRPNPDPASRTDGRCDSGKHTKNPLCTLCSAP